MYTLSTAVRATFLIVWLTVGAAYIGPATSQTEAPAQSREPPRPITGPATLSTTGGGPPTDPFLRFDTGMHTAAIIRISVDAANRYLITGSEDKTVRVWELASGRLLRTLRPPIGVGNEGKIFGALSRQTGRPWLLEG